MVVSGNGIGYSNVTCAKGNHICIPKNYSKYELPEVPTVVSLGIDIINIPKIDDIDFSVTLSVFLNVGWKDTRVIINPSFPQNLTPVDVNFMRKLWLPDLYIRNLKTYKTQNVLSKQHGLWVDDTLYFSYNIFSRITFFCPMKLDDFPKDIQACPFQVNYKLNYISFHLLQIGSFHHDISEMLFKDGYDASFLINSVLDYTAETKKLPKYLTTYSNGGDYSVAGFELILTRKLSRYIIMWYLPSGIFVIVSWISFLIPPEIVPGRMALIITVFLVLVNIFNTITTNMPKADRLTAIETYVMVCIFFVFGTLLGTNDL